MSGGGLYLLRYDEPNRVLNIALYDGDCLKAVVTGELAQDIYEHFVTLGDHAIRDSFIDGVLMGLRVAAPMLQFEVAGP